MDRRNVIGWLVRDAAGGRLRPLIVVLIAVCALPASALGAASLKPVPLPYTNGTMWNAVNASDQVAGSYVYPGAVHPTAVRWQDGTVTALPIPSNALTGTPNASAGAIDAAGGVFGGYNGADGAGHSRAYPVVWSPSLVPSGAATGIYDGSNGSAIIPQGTAGSENGNTAGWWCGNNGSSYTPCAYYYALAPTGSQTAYQFVSLSTPTLGGINGSIAINDAGELAIGYGSASYLYKDGPTGPMTPAAIQLAGTPRELNDGGDVIGQTVAGLPAIERADGTVEALPLLRPGDTAKPTAINDHGEVVGNECLGTSCTPVVWIDGHVVSVQSLVTGSFTDTLTKVWDVNEQGAMLAGSASGAQYLLEAGAQLHASIGLTNADGSPFTGVGAKLGDTVRATVTLSNPSATAPVTGLTVDPALSVAPAGKLQLVGGPTPAVPSTLGPGASAQYVMTYTIAALGSATLSLTANGTQDSLPASATASAIAHLGQALLVAVTFTMNNGDAIPNNTIKLADTDSGEVAQDITAHVTITNRSSLAQANLSLNGRLIPSFHSSAQALPTLPVSVIGGPDPPTLPATLAPGAKTTVTYGVHVEANGVFDLSSQVLSSDSDGGTTNVSSGIGTLTANPTALLVLKLHPVSDLSHVITAGQPVLLAGTLTNVSNTQSLDLLPIGPVPTDGAGGNAGGGLVMDSAQSALPDGVRPPLAGKIKPADVREVEVEIDTAPVPGTRATVTYAPEGFVVNDDGSETKLSGDQVRLVEGTSPFDLSFDTRDPVHSFSARSIAGNFAQGSFIAMSEWYLNGLHAAYEVANHPIDAQISALKGIASFVVATPTALKQSAGLLNSLYLLDEGLKDMTAAQKLQFVQQLVQDYNDSIPGGVVSGIQEAAAPVLEKFANALATGDYDQVAQMSGHGLATGGTLVADTVLTEFAFQKLALLAKAPAAGPIARSPLASEITLAQGIKDAKVTGKAGAALIGENGKKIEEGVNLLQNKQSILKNVYGLTQRQITLLRNFCESNGITVALRSRSKRAAELIKQGIAVAKNLVIKLKGVNEIDVNFLGYAHTDLNSVVWAEPISPAQLERNIARYKGEVDDNLRYLIQKRYAQRVEEWKNIDYRQKISTWDVSGKIKLEFDGAGSGVGKLDKSRVRYRRFELENNPAIVADKRGNKRYYKVFKVAKSEAKGAALVRVTQDVDLVGVFGGDGSILPAELRARAYEFMEDILGIQHPDTIPWVKYGEVLFESKVKLLIDHLAGGEALAAFGADGSVRTAFFDPHLTIFDRITKGGFVFLRGAYNDAQAPVAIGALGKLLKP